MTDRQNSRTIDGWIDKQTDKMIELQTRQTDSHNDRE